MHLSGFLVEFCGDQIAGTIPAVIVAFANLSIPQSVERCSNAGKCIAAVDIPISSIDEQTSQAGPSTDQPLASIERLPLPVPEIHRGAELLSYRPWRIGIDDLAVDAELGGHGQ